jgi:hypothetical protein
VAGSSVPEAKLVACLANRFDDTVVVLAFDDPFDARVIVKALTPTSTFLGRV